MKEDTDAALELSSKSQHLFTAACMHIHTDLLCCLSCEFKAWHDTPSEGFPSPAQVGCFERKEPCSYQSRFNTYQPDS